MQRTQMRTVGEQRLQSMFESFKSRISIPLVTTALSSRAHACMLCSVRGTMHGWRCCGGGRQALEALRKLRSEKTAEIKQFRLALDHTKTHKVHPIPAPLSPVPSRLPRFFGLGTPAQHPICSMPSTLPSLYLPWLPQLAVLLPDLVNGLIL